MSENDSKNQHQFTWIIRNYKFGDAKLFVKREIRSPPFTTEHIGQATWYLSIREFSDNWEDGVLCCLNRLLEDKGEKIVPIQWCFDFLQETGAFSFTIKVKDPERSECETGFFRWAVVIYPKMECLQSESLFILVCYINSCTPVENPSLCKSSAETYIKHNVLLGSESMYYQPFAFPGLEFKYDVSFSFQDNDVRVFIWRSDSEKANKCYFMYGGLCVTFENDRAYTREDIGWWKSFDSGEKLEIKTSLKSSFFQNYELSKKLRLHGLFVISTVKEKDCQTVCKNRCDILAIPKLVSSDVLKDRFPYRNQSDTKLDSSEVLKDDLLHMCNSKKFADVTLKVDCQNFPAHKCLLASRSPVFSSMFDQDMTENHTGIVTITDIDANTMNLFLQYLYTSKFDKICVDSALNLLLAAEKYEVPSLKGECASYLLSHLSDDNVCEVLAVADMISHHHLKSSSMSYIKKHADKVLLSDSWKHLCTKNVQLVSEVFLMMSKEYGNALGGK